MILTSNPYEQYRQQSVTTASPGELVVMLYDGCIRQLKVATMAMENETELANAAMLKAQAIIQELAGSLDRRYKISAELSRLYEYMENVIFETITSRDKDALVPVTEMLQELHEAWQQAARQTRSAGLSIDIDGGE